MYGHIFGKILAESSCRPWLWSVIGPAPAVSVLEPILQSKSSSGSWESWHLSFHWSPSMLKLQAPGELIILSARKKEIERWKERVCSPVSKLSFCSPRRDLFIISTHRSQLRPIHQHSRPCRRTPGGTQCSGRCDTQNLWAQDNQRPPQWLKHTDNYNE